MLLDSMFNDTIFYKKDSELEYQKKALEALETEFPNNRLIKNQLKICNLELKAERVIARELKHSNLGMYVIQDLNLVYRDVKIQIDYIVITPGFIYLIEYKNISGNISVNERGDFYRTIDIKKSYSEEIDSPIRQIDKHKALLKKIWLPNISKKFKEKFESAYDRSYKAIIVFTNPKTNLDLENAPKEIRTRVLKAEELIPYIKRDLEKFKTRKEFIDSKDEMHDQAYSLADFHVDLNENWDKKYRDLFGLSKPEPKTVKKPVQKIMPKREEKRPISRKLDDNPKLRQLEKKQRIIESETKKKPVVIEKKPLPRRVENRTVNERKKGNPKEKIQLQNQTIRSNEMKNNIKKQNMPNRNIDKVNQIKSVMASNHKKEVDVEGLRKKLIRYRISKCRQNDVPEQYIFSDEELTTLVVRRPKNVDEMTRKKILTPVKIRMFGQDIVDIIKTFEE